MDQGRTNYSRKSTVIHVNTFGTFGSKYHFQTVVEITTVFYRATLWTLQCCTEMTESGALRLSWNSLGPI